MHNVDAAPDQRPKNLHWQYRIIVIPVEVVVAAERAAGDSPTNPLAGHNAMGGRLEGMFNDLGEKGWELASYSDAMAIFKRPLA